MDNKLYCFSLGNNHSLCKVEIINVLYHKEINFKIVESSQEVLIIETEINLEQVVSIDEFGSTAKFIKILNTIDYSKFIESPNYIAGEYLLPSETNRHIQFGISIYGAGCKYKSLDTIFRLSQKIVNHVKEYLSDNQIRSGFLPVRERILTTATVDNDKILAKGFELVIAVGVNLIYVGKTISIQDYKSYSFRDYQRPAKDSKSGMIPPKLAKMMINLAKKDKDQHLLDPFCGSGTFLMEMLLLGYKNIAGSDLDQTAINNSKTNTEWIKQHYPQINKDSKTEIFQCDVRKISSKITKKNIDAIITEPYLGSPKAVHFNQIQINQEIKKLEQLYIDSFKEFSRILAKFGVIVIIFPVFKYKGDFYYLEILDSLKLLGFKQKDYLPDKYSDQQNSLRLSLTDRKTIVYYRPDQTVSREILLFTKK